MQPGVIMDSIIEVYENLTGFKAVRKTAGEYCGPCPRCGGRDRFLLFQGDSSNAGRFWCRGCGAKGGSASLRFKLKNSSAGQVPAAIAPKREVAMSIAAVPPEITYPAYLDLVERFTAAIENLLTEKILANRGLTMETAKKYGLGFSSGQKRYLPLGKDKKATVPAGLVIPNMRDGTLRSIKVRCLCTDGGKYRTLLGCPAMPYIIKANSNGNTPVIIVESELDAVLMAQECGSLFNYIALGSATNAPATDVASMISKAGKVFFCPDYDPEGIAAYQRWKLLFPRIELALLPKGKDPTEAKQLGVGLKAWALGVRGIGQHEQITRELCLSYHTVATEEDLAECVQRMVDAANGKKVRMAFCHDTNTDRCAFSDGKTAVVGNRALFLPVIRAFAKQCRIITHDPYAFRLGWGEMPALDGTRFLQIALSGEDMTLFQIANRYLGHGGGTPGLLGNTSSIPPDKALAADAYSISQLFTLLGVTVKDNGVINYYNLLKHSQEAVTQMMRNGIAFDWEGLKAFPKEYDMYAPYRDENGRVHSVIKPCGAITGRMTSSDICLHSVPSEIKHLAVPQEGFVFVDVDLKQSELRLAAELAKDKTLLSFLVEGRDCHAITAARIFKKDVATVTHEERAIGKAANFGFLYGQDEKGLYYKLAADDVFTKSNPPSEDDLALCLSARQEFEKQFPVLTEWLKMQKDLCWAGRIKDYPNGGVRTGIGRRIPLLPFEWLWENKVGNYIIQGTGADFMLAILCKLPALLKGLGGRIILTVYDEVLLEVPEEHAEKAVEVTHEAICKAFTMLFPEADTRNLADIGVGKSWAEAKGK